MGKCSTWNDGGIIMEKTSEKLKQEIDQMDQVTMCRIWRFGSEEIPFQQYLQGDIGVYFRDRLFKHFGGFTPETSKRIGW